ncbi:hypothetical protein PR002_g31046 [Phytophthora rubi]|uniref:Major facilitator superfamily (MFS) profile domain-containing protein n=2 Tax=Phytophthora TaxID=4783 RepID=A0A6A3GMI2_9STRA|nr:hypothetical protein PR002_g31046 [Phytophthora rubi]
MTADIFPDSIRASASSLCIGINWLCNLIVGVSYPYVSDALNDYAYVPFVVLLAIFYLLALKLVPETSGKSAEEIQADWGHLSYAKEVAAVEPVVEADGDEFEEQQEQDTAEADVEIEAAESVTAVSSTLALSILVACCPCLS